MSERERRRRVEVAHTVAVLTERRCQVCVGLGTRMAGNLDRQFSGGIDPAGYHPGQGPATLLAGKEGLDDRGRPPLVLAERVRATRHDHQDGWPTGLQDGLDQLRLVTRQAEILRVAAFSGCPATE